MLKQSDLFIILLVEKQQKNSRKGKCRTTNETRQNYNHFSSYIHYDTYIIVKYIILANSKNCDKVIYR